MKDQTQLPVVGVVLAGGLSRRMFVGQPGGGYKGLLDLDGRSMIEHVIHRLAPQVRHMIVNANGTPDQLEQLHARLRLPIVPDTVEGFVGPLAGVLAGLRWTAANVPAATHIVSVSSDAPFLPGNLVERLATAISVRSGPIALAGSLGEVQPVIGLWPVALADDLEAALRSGVRKVLAWTDRHGTAQVDFPALDIAGVAVDPFFNANTPAELDEARRLLALKSA